MIIAISQWKFSSQKGMKNNFLAEAGFEAGTTEFPPFSHRASWAGFKSII